MDSLYPPTQLAGILLHITKAHVKTTEKALSCLKASECVRVCCLLMYELFSRRAQQLSLSSQRATCDLCL